MDAERLQGDRRDIPIRIQPQSLSTQWCQALSWLKALSQVLVGSHSSGPCQAGEHGERNGNEARA